MTDGDNKVTRRVYSAEELYRLRSSCSQPKLREAIEEHDREDAELVKVHKERLEHLIADTPTPRPRNGSVNPSVVAHESPTEHVLRGSKSFAARSFRSRASGNSLRVPSSNKENRSTNDTENSRPSTGPLHASTNSVLGEIAPNSQVLRSGPFKLRPSPTPSLKKKKAEAIVKAHGSPQHVRVTAGGRIVASEQSPLCHPRYGYSAMKTNGGLIKFAPNHPMGKAQWSQATEDGFIAQDINGRLCQIVNGTILPLNEVDGALRLYLPAPNLSITSRGSSFGPSAHAGADPNGTQPTLAPQSKPSGLPKPTVAAQTNALELEYSKLECELKDLDKTEVLHGRTMGKAAKDALIGKRRELVVTLDNIRKAIKSIKNLPPPDAPTSPRALQNRQSMSPPRNRLPAFLQQRGQQKGDQGMQAGPPAYGPFFGVSQHQQYGFQPTPSPEGMYGPQPFGMPGPPMFVPPPPFDGSMGPAFVPYQDPMGANVMGAPTVPQPSSATGNARTGDSQLAQTDGARSFADLHRVGSPPRSHAVDIKLPSSALKSTLNPMSPAYKPGHGVLQSNENRDRPSTRSVKDRAPTPLSPLHQLRPAVATNKAVNTTDDTISPTKKNAHLQSSSISSFETADFFPRNTREFSTRKWAYRDATDQSDRSEDKENVSPKDGLSPLSAASDQSNAVKNTKSPRGEFDAPIAPPGTPATRDNSVVRPHTSTQTDRPVVLPEPRPHGLDFASLPDRQTHNLSPKGRHQDYIFVQEHPALYSSEASALPEKTSAPPKEPCIVSSPVASQDFTEASTDWLEGYRAGLARRPVGADRAGDFLDGYCAGLLKSKPATLVPSNGSPVKSISRRPSPVVIQSRSSSRLQQGGGRDPMLSLAPLEIQVQSTDTLKQAVFAPQNENAILTPTPNGPHASEHNFNLGGWAKAHELSAAAESQASTRGDGLAGFPFPHRTVSMIQRQGIMSEDAAMNKALTDPNHTQTTAVRQDSAVSGLSGNPAYQSDPSSSIAAHMPINTVGNRITSINSIDSNLYRQYPGHRVFSPHLEWKSASSVAQAAGLASGLFAQAQFDGAHLNLLRQHSFTRPAADTCAETGAPQAQRAGSITSNETMLNHSRFREGSLDGMSNPPNSPQLASPPMSPVIPSKDTPTKDSKKESPGKGGSPAKVKFEHIAEKVGIKVTAGKKEHDSSPNSPPEKRRWRDVWRGSRKDSSKDESGSVPYN